jgi:hypothetical protein
MIKEMILNSQKIPVPLPIFTGDDLIDWLQGRMARQGQIITKLVINGQNRTNDLDTPKLARLQLSELDIIEVSIDSAADLVLDSMEAIVDFSRLVLQGIKGLAVGLFQYDGKQTPSEVANTVDDLRTMIGLYEHVSQITDISTGEIAAFEGLNRLIRRAFKSFESHISHRQWEDAARVLLNQLEPLIRDLMDETERLHIRLGLDIEKIIEPSMLG